MPKKTPQQARERLKARAKDFQNKQLDQALKHQPPFQLIFRPPPLHVLTPEQTEQHTFYAEGRAQGWEPRCGAGNSKVLVKRLYWMREIYRRLSLWRFSIPGFVAQDLQTDDGRRRVKAAAVKIVDAFLDAHGLRVETFSAVIEHGLDYGMHVHLLVPHFQLCPFMQAVVWAAPHGRGGGVTLPSGSHGVVLGDTKADMGRVGGYLSKYPDARAKWSMHHPRYHGKPELEAEHLALYLELKDELAQRRLAGLPAPKVKLSWYTTRRKRPKTCVKARAEAEVQVEIQTPPPVPTMHVFRRLFLSPALSCAHGWNARHLTHFFPDLDRLPQVWPLVLAPAPAQAPKSPRVLPSAAPQPLHPARTSRSSSMTHGPVPQVLASAWPLPSRRSPCSCPPPCTPPSASSTPAP